MHRILVADDEPNIAAALEFLLRRSGYDVSVARNGDEALKLIEQNPPDLVLLDVMMPLLSGYDVCRAMRRSPELRHIKVVILTAKSQDSDTDNGFTVGADLYMTKPFSNRELVARINGLLGRPPQA